MSWVDGTGENDLKSSLNFRTNVGRLHFHLCMFCWYLVGDRANRVAHTPRLPSLSLSSSWTAETLFPIVITRISVLSLATHLCRAAGPANRLFGPSTVSTSHAT